MINLIRINAFFTSFSVRYTPAAVTALPQTHRRVPPLSSLPDRDTSSSVYESVYEEAGSVNMRGTRSFFRTSTPASSVWTVAEDNVAERDERPHSYYGRGDRAGRGRPALYLTGREGRDQIEE